MKKIAIAFLCFILCFVFFACGEDSNSNPPGAPEVPDILELPSVPDLPTKEENILQIEVENSVFTVSLYENETVKQFIKMMPMTVNMGELNGNEKYYYLPKKLPTNSQNVGKINIGDLMLYDINCVVLFYESFSTSYSYTKLGKVENATGLAKALGRGAVMVTFRVKQ